MSCRAAVASLFFIALAGAACGDDGPTVLTPTPPAPDAAPPRADAGAWLDPSFGEGGYLIPDGLNEAELGGVARAPDGRVYFGGQSGSFDDLDDPVRPFVCRIGGDGLDADFGAAGCTVDLEAPDTAWMWNLFADDEHVVLLGNALDAAEDRYQGTLWQLDASGARAAGFGTEGEARVDEPPSGSTFTALVDDGAGGYIALLDHYVINTPMDSDEYRLAHVDESGVITFLPSFVDAGDELGGFLRTPDGDRLLVGVTRAAPTSLTLWRLGPDFQPDPRFGDGGRLVLPVRGSLRVDPTPPGSFLVKTALLGPTEWGSEIRRFSLDGQLDPTFGAAGVVRLDRLATDLAVLPDGRIAVPALVGFGAGLDITVLGHDGRPDVRISPTGSVRFDAPGFSGNAQAPTAALVDAQGRLLVFRSGEQGQVDPINPSPIVFVTRVVIPAR